MKSYGTSVNSENESKLENENDDEDYLVKKRSETELAASVLKKRSKTHKRLKERFLFWTKREKKCKFSRKSSFSSYVQHKNKQLIQLILCQLDARSI